MIYNLIDDFTEKIYPKLGTAEVWDLYNKFYYEPNKEILNRHFNRWDKFEKKKLKNKVIKWKKEDFNNIIKEVEKFNFTKIQEVVKKSEDLLDEVNNLEIYFLIGDFRSGIYIDQYKNKNIIIIAFEVVSQYGNPEEIISPVLSHELFHLYHYNQLDKKGVIREENFSKLLIDDGLASYFSYLVNPEYSLEKILLYSRKQMNMIKNNEQLYWKEISQAMQNKSTKECILLFIASRKMWEERLNYIPDWPPRISYYYGFKIVEQYIKEKGEDYIKELMFLSPENIISESKYLKELRAQ